MNYAEEITSRINMEDVFAEYGFTANRAGFITCPFHSEKTASLKMYANKQRFKCFGCGEGGSVIDFVMKMENLPFRGAVIKINDAFNLGLPLKTKLTYREKAEAKKRAKKRELIREIKNGYFESKSNLYDCLEDSYKFTEVIINKSEPWNDTFAKAVRVKALINYELDNFEFGRR